MRLAQHLHLFIRSIRSSTLRPEEEALGAGVEKAGASVGARGEWAVVDEGLAQITQI